MKRQEIEALVRQAQEAKPPRFRETLRVDSFSVSLECVAEVVVDLGRMRPLSLDFSVVARTTHAHASVLTPAELRRVAEIREAVDRWMSGEGEWPVSRDEVAS